MVNVEELERTLRQGGHQVRLEPCCLGAVAAGVCARLLAQARAGAVELRLTVEPGADGRFDRAGVDQVLTELVSNAIRRGAGPVDIRVRGTELGAELVVQDTGARFCVRLPRG